MLFCDHLSAAEAAVWSCFRSLRDCVVCPWRRVAQCGHGSMPLFQIKRKGHEPVFAKHMCLASWGWDFIVAKTCAQPGEHFGAVSELNFVFASEGQRQLSDSDSTSASISHCPDATLAGPMLAVDCWLLSHGMISHHAHSISTSQPANLVTIRLSMSYITVATCEC